MNNLWTRHSTECSAILPIHVLKVLLSGFISEISCEVLSYWLCSSVLKHILIRNSYRNTQKAVLSLMLRITKFWLWGLWWSLEPETEVLNLDTNVLIITISWWKGEVAISAEALQMLVILYASLVMIQHKHFSSKSNYLDNSSKSKCLSGQNEQECKLWIWICGRFDRSVTNCAVYLTLGSSITGHNGQKVCRR